VNTLPDRIKESIRGRHSEMEQVPYVKALMGGNLPFNCYIAQLKAMAIIHGTIERELAVSDIQGIKGLILPRPSRFGHLRTDLSVLKAHAVPDCIKAVNQALRITEEIRLARVEKTERLIGFFYVLEGTTLGNMVHLRDVKNTFGDKVRGATNYYQGYGDKTIYYWDEFRGFLNGLSNHTADIVIASAHRLFDLLEPLYQALYPVNKEDWGYLATTLNPEAGRHPVPSDILEIQASISAGNKCLQEFPYLYERYQERGKAFTYSDAAWLITLSRLPKGECLRQVQWLGRVLGNRGIPRITLERQLEILYEELLSNYPERRDIYSGLLEAASSLKAERLSYIDDTTFKGLSSDFSMATEGEICGRFQRTGELILSAVCDERAGIEDALNSLIPWLTDSNRFPDKWIKAVHNILTLTKGSLLR